METYFTGCDATLNCFMDIFRFSAVLLAIFFMHSSLAFAEKIDVDATPIPLIDSAPEQITVGKLEYRGGLHLTSSNRRFGGFSGLGISSDGLRMVSVSDGGTSYSANLEYDAVGNLSGMTSHDLGALADLDGTPVAGKRWSDAEAMSPGVEGEIIVAFERAHRLWRYDAGATTPRVLRPPEELNNMPPNDGIEALTLLNDGRLFAITEGSPHEPASVAWVSRRGGWDVLTYIAEDGFRPTGAATLPNGDVLVLERYYTARAGVRIRIKRIDGSKILAGEEISGELVADMAPPMNIDNFEGIEVRQDRQGRTFVYLISDDNFSGDQRTLLMMFELVSS